MDNNLLHVRQLCLDQAKGLLGAARAVIVNWPHVGYHLALLGLEEVGKASMLGVRAIQHESMDGSWIERGLDSHQRKLQWAVWSPFNRIDPADFESARLFAARAHALRLASLYVDPDGQVEAPPPHEQVTSADATNALTLAEQRWELEAARELINGNVDELTHWFLDMMADPEGQAQLLSRAFVAKFEALGGDARKWIAWTKDEIARIERKNVELAAAELAKSGTLLNQAKPRWRANTVVYTPSHSLRPKVLALWNSHIETVQLLWTGKKDRFTLQVVLHDNAPFQELAGKLTSLSKLVAACLSIGSIGYFWFEEPGFGRAMFTEIRDLERDALLQISGRESFWGDGRAVALNETHIRHSLNCMLAYASLRDEEAAPIFQPYLDGLALLSKSDLFYSFDDVALSSFASSLAGAMKRYGGWTGRDEDFEESFHINFEAFMPDLDHRIQMLETLRNQQLDRAALFESIRSAKHLADLFLIHTAERLSKERLCRLDAGDENG